MYCSICCHRTPPSSSCTRTVSARRNDNNQININDNNDTNITNNSTNNKTNDNDNDTTNNHHTNHNDHNNNDEGELQLPPEGGQVPRAELHHGHYI